VFGRVIDNGKMLRNFVQIVRSGAMGRKSLGSAPKKLVQNWLLNASEKQLLSACRGQAAIARRCGEDGAPQASGGLAFRMVCLVDRQAFDEASLPPITQAFERFKRDAAQGLVSAELPDVPFQMLTALELKPSNGRRSPAAAHGRWCARTSTPLHAMACSRSREWRR
jgi:60 kDa SS-A/Ro ribonucleoprotein